MAVAASALRNRNSMKMREAFEAYVARGVEPSKEKNEVDISYVEKSLESANIKIDKKEFAKLQNICKHDKISRYFYDFYEVI